MISSRQFRLLTLVTMAGLHAQDPKSHDRPGDIRVHSDLVLINALVTDGQGAVITGLGASAFRLFEGGKEQVVRYCASEDVPVSVGLILDTSGSMGNKLALLNQAALQFVRAGNPADEYFLIEFGCVYFRTTANCI
jgi:VWFA-related protein